MVVVSNVVSNFKKKIRWPVISWTLLYGLEHFVDVLQWPIVASPSFSHQHTHTYHFICRVRPTSPSFADFVDLPQVYGAACAGHGRRKLPRKHHEPDVQRCSEVFRRHANDPDDLGCAATDGAGVGSVDLFVRMVSLAVFICLCVIMDGEACWPYTYTYTSSPAHCENPV